MKWQRKEKSIYDCIQKCFAFFPIEVGDRWIWLETYYRLRCWNMLGCYEEEYRWITKEEAEFDLSEAVNAHTD